MVMRSTSEFDCKVQGDKSRPQSDATGRGGTTEIQETCASMSVGEFALGQSVQGDAPNYSQGNEVTSS